MDLNPFDGIGIVLELSRPATEADLVVARDLLEEWLTRYDEGPRYRNCGLEGDAPRSTRVVLWADRVDDADGPEAAIAHAESIARRASTILPVRSWRLSGGKQQAEGDLEARLGVPLVAVRPGGDLVADLERAGLLPVAKRRRFSGRLLLAAALAVALLSWGAWRVWRALTPGVVRDLPSDASVVHYVSQDVFPDVSFFAAAHLPDASCRRHVRESFADFVPVDLASIAEDDRVWVDWGRPFDEDGAVLEWWAPAPMESTNTWFHRDDDIWEIVQCAGDRFHFRSYSH
ncbi:MAG: hypothetical protein K8H88_29305 [Sandaracinaceae bacterium]|nr:hypothetical protein [Sandaracinaceae bacterium]